MACRPVVLRAGEMYLLLEDALARGWNGVTVIPCEPGDRHLAGWAVYALEAEGRPARLLSVHKTAKLAEWDMDAEQAA